MLEFWVWNLGKCVRISCVLVEIRNESFVITVTAMCVVLTEFILFSATSWFCDNCSYLVFRIAIAAGRPRLWPACCHVLLSQLSCL